jgi:hypothetical protein
MAKRTRTALVALMAAVTTAAATSITPAIIAGLAALPVD